MAETAAHDRSQPTGPNFSGGGLPGSRPVNLQGSESAVIIGESTSQMKKDIFSGVFLASASNRAEIADYFCLRIFWLGQRFWQIFCKFTGFGSISVSQEGGGVALVLDSLGPVRAGFRNCAENVQRMCREIIY